MSQATALNSFLTSVEKRAYAITLLSVKNPDDALDIVQDAMLKLARSYATKEPAQWPALFHRILKNRTTDFHRRQRVRSMVFGWLPSAEENDPVAEAVAAEAATPELAAQLTDFGPALLQALKLLPERQRQAFTLRVWEGLDVKQTAQAMGVSAGSVKTHYSRATKALREQLTEFNNELE